MTERQDPGVHPDIDQLADFDAGVEVPSEVRAHVGICQECQRALRALRATRDDIAALPESTMPADVAARIDAALATEPPPLTGKTVVPIASLRDRKRRNSYLAGGIAASVIGLLVAGIVVGSTVGDNGGKKGTTNAASAGRSTIAVVQATGRNYTDQTLNTGVAGLLHTQAEFMRGTTGTAGSGGTAQGSGSVAGAPQAPAPSSSLAHKTMANDQLVLPPQLTALQTDPAALSHCIQTLLGPSPKTYVAPLAVDIARFNGQPSAIFVFPKPNDPAHLAVYVVPTDGCTTGIFQFHNVPR